MVDTGAPKTQMGWEIHPDGLVDVIEMVHDRAPELPVYITENGAAYADEVEPDGRIADDQNASATSSSTPRPAPRPWNAVCRSRATSPGA